LDRAAAILRTPVLQGFGSGQEAEGHEQSALDFAPGDFVELLTASNEWGSVFRTFAFGSTHTKRNENEMTAVRQLSVDGCCVCVRFAIKHRVAQVNDVVEVRIKA
jgi:hypothetical protein